MIYLFVCLLLLLVGFSNGAPSRRWVEVDSDKAVNGNYDFIVVGGGTAGLTVADRLTEDPETSVLVVEYGYLDRREPKVVVPGLLNYTEFMFNYTSVPQPGINNRTGWIPAAAVVGGSTVVNGILFDRGAREDYDAWEELGNPGWGWTDLLPYFKKSEIFTPPAETFAEEWNINWDGSVHGEHGSVHSSYPVFQYPIIKNYFSAFRNLGLPWINDPASGTKNGIVYAASSLNPTNQTRSDSRAAHYDTVGARPNYHLLTGHAVNRVTFDEKAASGVVIQSRASNETNSVIARKEVIIAAGAFHSPGILQRSGIGRASVLRNLGISSVADLPGVGQNFQDHPTTYSAFNYTTTVIPNADYLQSNQTYAQEQLALYYVNRTGAYTNVFQGGNVVAFMPLKSLSPEYSSIVSQTEDVDVKSVFTNETDPSVIAGYLAQREIILRLYQSDTAPIHETGTGSGAVRPQTLLRPLSRGSIDINSLDAFAHPLVDYGVFKYPTDIRILAEGIKFNRELMQASPLVELGPTEILPGKAVITDENLFEALRAIAAPTYQHPCCSLPMMSRDLGGVLDHELLVYGVERLSVVDASMMPIIPATHTSATVYAVAEKAADIIKKRHALNGKQSY